MTALTQLTGVVDVQAEPILNYLKQHGQGLDREIAAATGIPLPKIRTALSDLSARGEISRCSVTRFIDGKPGGGVNGRSTPLSLAQVREHMVFCRTI